MSTRILGEVQKAEGTLTSVAARASGEVAKLPAGSMLLALGVEYLKDEAEYTNNFTLIRQAASSGLELAEDSSGDRNATAVMAELVVPVTKTFELNFAIRYDDYSDFGATTNPKVSFRWQPTQQWLARGSYNTGFRAPTLYDVYAPNSITYTGETYDDPLLCPGGVLNTALGGVEGRDCAQQFQQQQGGNSSLNPETSKAWSLGVAFQPNENFMVGVDYWNYKVEDSIGVTGENVIFGDPTKYAGSFVRCGSLSAEQQAALPGTCTGNPNILAYIVNTTVNLGNYKASGLDFTANWQSAASDWGRFSVGYRSTYMLQYEYQLEANGPYFDNLGNFFNGGPVNRYRQVLNFGWQRGAWSTNLVNNFSSAYEDQDPYVDGKPRTVGSVNTWDMAVTWAGIKGLTLTGSITNLFDQDPPFSNQSGGFQVGYDYRYANPIGRAFLLRGTYQF
jgi:iron complex outermembrane recepter protein